MARSFARGRPRTGPKRLTNWSRTDASSGGTAFKAAGAATAVLDQTLASSEPETIVRARGSVCVLSDQNGADEQAFGAYGIAVVSDQAAAIGVTAIPTPYTDADSDLWMVHGYWYCPIQFGDSTGFADVSQVFDFDSKAMRRLSPDETLVMVIENGSAAQGALYSFNAALLLKAG